MTPVSLDEVNIETVNTCTLKCSYCKFGLKRNWDKKTMSPEVFEKILYDLQNINYSGLLGPFVNNEPLMDKRIVSFIKMISTILPLAQSYLFTNGDLLNKELLQRFFDSGLHKIFISVHSDKRLKIFSELVRLFGNDRVSVATFFDSDTKTAFHNRGGSIKSEIVNQSRFLEEGCCLPFRQAVINPDGDVYLCCCDFYYDVVFDNVKNSSLVDIFFNNSKLSEIRKQLTDRNRRGLPLCESCSVPAYAPLLKL